ncbi:UNVERIFIED_CONTAM: hypothetical protein Sradi_0171000 [Sesamum radiatum]|uniref:Uncharacterized protein n=1 Tax=Sesamum radiatum TaxID=300843 RepID=A0AAW2W072_SESRA
MAYVGRESDREVSCDAQDYPAVVKYQGQYLSCEWTIETSTLKPRDPTRGHALLGSSLVHGGLMAKICGRGATLHCGQIVKPC